MNLNARWNCLRLCVATVLAVPTALLSAEPLVNLVPPLPTPVGDKANDPKRFWVSGVVYMTGTPVALLTDTARSRSRFVWGDHPVDRYRVREVTREYLTLIEPRSGKELKIFVDTRTESTDPRSTVPALYTKEWINSPANPMFGNLVYPPHELYGDWPTATDADKAEIAGFYEKYGWKLVRAEVVAGAVDFVWEWLYEADRIAGAQTSREAFVGLLSPDQRRTWEEIHANGSIHAVDGKSTPEQQLESDRRRQVFQQFKATFTSEQKAAFENMSRRSYSPREKSDRKEPEFTLPRLTATDAATPGGPVPYTRAWINSKANPMLQQVESFPRELTQNWATLSLADRTQVVEYYQKHGWQLLHLETVGGITSFFSWQNIYGEERSAVLQAKREAFFNLLTPEQRRAYKGGPISQIVPTLDARQRAAYEEMQDFTQADWN